MKDKHFFKILLVINLSIIFFIFFNKWPTLFYDLVTFFNGSKDELLGFNAYRSKELNFVYHPVILDFNLFLEQFRALQSFYILSICSSFLLLIFSYKRYLKFYGMYNFKSFNILLGLFAYGFIFAELMVKMNISLLLNNIILSIILFDVTSPVRKNRVAYVGIVSILLFAIIKPYLLAYLIYFFLSRRALTLKVGIIAVPFFLGFFFPVSKILYPEKYPLFMEALSRQTINRPDGLIDVGFSYFGFLYRFLSAPLSFLGHGFIVSILILIYLRLRNFKLDTSGFDAPSSIFILMLIIISLNPRMMVYDFFYILLFIPCVIKVKSKLTLFVVVFCSLFITVGNYFQLSWSGSVQKVVWWAPVFYTLLSIIVKDLKLHLRSFTIT